MCGCQEFRWGHRAKAEERKHWENYHGNKKGQAQ
jgi:hypothetical protein